MYKLGADIDGESTDDFSGCSVSLSSDGTTLAIGAAGNDGSFKNSGHVRVYSWNGSSWNKLGADIDGESADDNFGGSVSLSSDGTTLAVGATGNDGNGTNSGHVRVYNIFNSIKQLIKKIVEIKINEWQEKGEFEKTYDYKIRVAKENRDKKIIEIQNITIDRLKQNFLATCSNNNLSLIEYDADNETFLIEKNLQEFILEVPINKAKYFKENFNNCHIDYLDCAIVDGNFILTSFKVSFLNGDYYIYDSSKNNTFQKTNFNFSFDEIDIEINEYSSNSNKIIRTKQENIGISLVDINIIKNIKVKNRYALIVGNENYSSYQKTLEREQDVPYAVNDASIFKEYALKTLGVEEDNLYYLENATSGQMNQTIDLVTKIVSKLGNKAELIFYYAGHGFPDELTKEPYLIPVDVSTSYLNNAISLDDLYDKFSNTGAKKVLAFVDACFSGGARENSLLVSRGVKINPKMTNISNNLVVFSASSETQSALPYDEQGHGMFTFYLLNKLKESSGKISLGELYDYVSEEVSLNSLKINQTEQEPNVIFSPTIENKWRNWQLY